MRDVSPTVLVHWMGGHDFAGIGALTDLTDPHKAAYQDVTPLGPMGRYRRESPTGQEDYRVTERGFAKGRAASLRKMMLNAPTPPYQSIVGRFGSAMGAECTIASGMFLEKDCLVQDRGSLTRIEMDYVMEDEGAVYRKAFILHGGARIGAAVAAPYAGYRYDSGARNPNGIVAAIQIDDDVVWDGATGLTALVRHSPGGTVLLQQNGQAARGIRIGYGDADNTWTLVRAARGGNPIGAVIDAAAKTITVSYAAADTLDAILAALPPTLNAQFATANTDGTARAEAPGGVARAFANPVWTTAAQLDVAPANVPGTILTTVETAVERYFAFAWTWSGAPGINRSAKAIAAVKRRT